MTKPTISQSQKRYQESVASLFSRKPEIPGRTTLFLKSSSDMGVIRNGGRNGARFAPQSFLATFKKFSQNQSTQELSFLDFEVSSSDEEEANFQDAQKNETRRITELVTAHPGTRICHLGGGHDHIYPLLSALSPKYANVIVINIDAHADTRTDENHHSGTPFRQFAKDYPGHFTIYQIGLHPFANSSSTLSDLEKAESKVLWKNDLNDSRLDEIFKEVQGLIDQKTLVVFSLDADALNGAEVPGVSAVNPSGLTRHELMNIWKRYQKLSKAHPPVLGIYELNPLYDTLASISMRTIASFVYESYL